MSNPRAEAFIELYPAGSGHNLRHFHWSDTLGHLTGEGCPCAPERIDQADTPGGWRGIPDVAETTTDVPSCLLCGRERTLLDAYDYNPLQVVTGQRIGWYSGDDGEICGACMTTVIRGQR